MSSLEPRVSFSSNFASLFSVMRDSSSVLFHLKVYMLWTKGAHQNRIFQTFECSNESSPNFSCHFWNHKVRIHSNFALLLSVMKNNSSVFLYRVLIDLESLESLEKSLYFRRLRENQEYVPEKHIFLENHHDCGKDLGKLFFFDYIFL